jgi:hypothetical protein
VTEIKSPAQGRAAAPMTVKTPAKAEKPAKVTKIKPAKVQKLKPAKVKKLKAPKPERHAAAPIAAAPTETATAEPQTRGDHGGGKDHKEHKNHDD